MKRATKKQIKLRLAVFAPSGGGKTMTALRIASGMVANGGKIAMIDTERGSGSRYADQFVYDVEDLQDRTIESYLKVISETAASGYEVIIIDSLSHAWQELMAEVDRLAKTTRYKGNSWGAWSEGTPKQRALVEAIVSYPGHVIATMRSKTEWVIEEGRNGKKKPVRIGMAPEQGKGIEYEFDLLMEMDINNQAAVSKDRTGKFQGAGNREAGRGFRQGTYRVDRGRRADGYARATGRNNRARDRNGDRPDSDLAQGGRDQRRGAHAGASGQDNRMAQRHPGGRGHARRR